MHPRLPAFWNRLLKKHPAILCDEKKSVSLVLKNLSVGYHRTSIISNLSCTFTAPGLWAIIGPNGAGKSTLLKTLLGLQKFTAGEITFNGLCPCDVAYLAQQNQLDRRFPLTVGDTIAMGLFRQVGLFRSYTPEQRRKMQAALDRVGLSAFSKTPLQSLSGGQFQRVLFARLILQDAPVILLDEPFTGVDGRTLEDLINLIHEWVQEGRLVIAVLHHMDLVEDHFPNTLLLARHFSRAGPTSTVITRDNMLEATRASRQWEEGVS